MLLLLLLLNKINTRNHRPRSFPKTKNPAYPNTIQNIHSQRSPIMAAPNRNPASFRMDRPGPPRATFHIPFPPQPAPATDFTSMLGPATPSRAHMRPEQIEMHTLSRGGDIERRAGQDPVDNSEHTSVWFKIRPWLRPRLFWIWPLLAVILVLLGILGGVAYAQPRRFTLAPGRRRG